MNSLVLSAQRFLLDEEGLAAIEYGLMAATIAVAVLVSGKAVGTGLTTVFARITACLSATTAAANTCV